MTKLAECSSRNDACCNGRVASAKVFSRGKGEGSEGNQEVDPTIVLLLRR